MCFSATASFGAGTALTLIGIVTIRKAEKPSQLAFAAIPFLFAVQQISEGFVWLTLMNPEYAQWQQLPIHLFLIFSHIVWPLWIPFSILLIEKQPLRKIIIYIILSIAILLALCEIYFMIFYSFTAQVIGMHIKYDPDCPIWFTSVSNILYGIITFLPCFISSVKRMWVLGSTFIVALIVTSIFYHNYLISVWCYFAALLSFVVYSILIQLQKDSTIKPASLQFT